MEVTCTIYLNKTCFGLNRDAVVLMELLKKSGVGESYVKILDMNEPPVSADIAFHLETPVSQVLGYAHCNILMINSEQWIGDVYDPYLHSFDLAFVRCSDDLERFQKELQKKNIEFPKIFHIPWSLGSQNPLSENLKLNEAKSLKRNEIVCLLGKNQYKFEWLRDFIKNGNQIVWAPDSRDVGEEKETGEIACMTIYTSESKIADELNSIVRLRQLKIENDLAVVTRETSINGDSSLVPVLDVRGSKDSHFSEKIKIIKKDLTSDEINNIQASYSWHLLCSRGEGFGYGAAEAEAVGANLILNELPVFKEYYKDISNVVWLPNRELEKTDLSLAHKASNKFRYRLTSPSQTNSIITLKKKSDDNFINMSEVRKKTTARWITTLVCFQRKLWESALEIVKTRRSIEGNRHCPPILMPQDCPNISIITPTRNRKKLIDIAFHNLLITDYPLDKIEWIVIENSSPALASYEKLINFQINCKKIKQKYIPLQEQDEERGEQECKKLTIGEMRNIGIDHSSHDIILFMDDDDHYPPTSFRRRVAWLQRAKQFNRTICGCTTLALYDLRHGNSAVNVPPWDIPQSERISEATLTFYKSAWIERKFGDTSINEGSSWISGREKIFWEIPPQQIIVAFSHGENSTSRRVPFLEKPTGCFWGFPREYLEFVHGLVGVGVESADDSENRVERRRRR